MSKQQLTIHIASGVPVEGALAEALQRCAGRAGVTCVIVLAPDTRPDRKLVDVLVRSSQQIPAGGEIILVHSSPNLGFIVSSAALRIPQLKLHGVSSLDELRTLKSESSLASPSGSTSDDAGSDPLDAQRELVSRAFAQSASSGGSECVIVLDPTKRPARDLVEIIEQQARMRRSIRTIVLVHPLPVAGFLASTLGLRLPGVMVRAVATVDKVKD